MKDIVAKGKTKEAADMASIIMAYLVSVWLNMVELIDDGRNATANKELR